MRSQGRAERALTPRLRAVFAAAAERLASAVALADSADVLAVAARAFDPVDVAQAVRRACRPVLKWVAEKGASDELQLHRPRARGALTRGPQRLPKLPKLPPAVQAGVDRYLRDLLNQPYWLDLGETARRKVVKALQDGLAKGEAGQALADRVRKAMGPKGSAARALVIARTETTSSLNAGAEAAREDLARMGAVNAKEWANVRDGRTREDHGTAGGQRARAGGFFIVGGELGLFPGDYRFTAAQRVRCRCAAISLMLTDQELQGLPA